LTRFELAEVLFVCPPFAQLFVGFIICQHRDEVVAAVEVAGQTHELRLHLLKSRGVALPTHGQMELLFDPDALDEGRKHKASDLRGLLRLHLFLRHIFGNQSLFDRRQSIKLLTYELVGYLAQSGVLTTQLFVCAD